MLEIFLSFMLNCQVKWWTMTLVCCGCCLKNVTKSDNCPLSDTHGWPRSEIDEKINIYHSWYLIHCYCHCGQFYMARCLQSCCNQNLMSLSFDNSNYTKCVEKSLPQTQMFHRLINNLKTVTTIKNMKINLLIT